MNEKTTELLSEYNLKVNRISRARGGFLCETDGGLRLFKEYKGTQKHLDIENYVLESLKESGCFKADFIVKNINGEMITKDTDGASYILKEWYQSHECSVWDKTEVCRAAGMLAGIHNALRGHGQEHKFDIYPCDLNNEYRRHIFEMKRARTFIRNKNNKNEFELKVLMCFDQFYEKGVEAVNELEKCSYDIMRNEADDSQTICHGSFNYHNILFSEHDVIPVNFERAVVDVQITDLYDFIRKVMEKYNWDIELGHRMIEEYDKIRSIPYSNRKLLHVMLTYPEKFWKIINQYYNGNKSWVPDKNVDKLYAVCNQDEMKTKFVNTIL